MFSMGMLIYVCTAFCETAIPKVHKGDCFVASLLAMTPHGLFGSEKLKSHHYHNY